MNLLQIRLNGSYFAVFSVKRTNINLESRQNLISPSRIFALIP